MTSKAPVTIIGSYLSPYVRKVLVCLDIKGVDYRIDPIVPFYGSDEFTRISPTRRIPVYLDETVTLPDSTVICEFLDEYYPGPALLPKQPVDRARARWLEEFADSRMGDVFIWALFNQRVINPFVWRQAPDEAILEKALDVDIPGILDFLETQLPANAYLFETISLADIAISVFFRNAAFAGFEPDPQRWPLTSGFIQRVLNHPAFLRLRPFEELCLRTPLPRHREALLAMGAPLTDHSLYTPTPRRGGFS